MPRPYDGLTHRQAVNDYAQAICLGIVSRANYHLQAISAGVHGPGVSKSEYLIRPLLSIRRLAAAVKHTQAVGVSVGARVDQYERATLAGVWSSLQPLGAFSIPSSVEHCVQTPASSPASSMFRSVDCPLSHILSNA